MIQVPQSILCADLNTLINRVYPRISHQEIKEDQYFLDCIILCSRNDEVHNINEAILQQFNPGPNTEVYILRSVDSVSEENGMHHTYPVEFLQQLNTSRLSPALLCLKVGCPVILLRNLDPGEGYHDLVKWLSYYFILLSFSFLIWTYYTRKKCRKVSHDNVVCHSHMIMSHDKCGRVVHRLYSSCISSIQNPIETPLSSPC